MSADSSFLFANTYSVCKHDLLQFKSLALLSKKALREKTNKRGLRVCVYVQNETEYGVSPYVAARTQDAHPRPGTGR